MKKFTLVGFKMFLHHHQKEWLQEYSENTGTSMSQIVRWAIERYQQYLTKNKNRR